MWLHKTFVVASIAIIQSATSDYDHHPLARKVDILNKSGRNLKLFWLPPDDKEHPIQMFADFPDGKMNNLNSFVNHTFMIQHFSSEAERNDACKAGFLTVNESGNQGNKIRNDLIPESIKIAIFFCALSRVCD